MDISQITTDKDCYCSYLYVQSIHDVGHPLSHLQTFAKAFNSTPDDLDMHIIYDVSHNIAKVEEHISYHVLMSLYPQTSNNLTRLGSLCM